MQFVESRCFLRRDDAISVLWGGLSFDTVNLWDTACLYVMYSHILDPFFFTDT